MRRKKIDHELDVVQIRLIKERTLYSESVLNSPENVIQFLTDEFASDRKSVV